jgi:hypothetical protein
LGDTSDDDREHGMGIVVEYANKRDTPKWIKPPKSKWDYTQFALPNATAQTPDETIEMTFAKHNAADNGFNLWTINGHAILDGENAADVFHSRRQKISPADAQRERRHSSGAFASSQL